MKKTNGWFKSAIALMAAVAGLTVQADGEGVPQAYVSIVDRGLVDSKDGFAMLNDPVKINSAYTYTDPFRLDVTYRFDAFSPNVKAVIDAITPALTPSGAKEANFEDFDKVDEAVSAALANHSVTEAQVSEAAAFLRASKPYWERNCDFVIKFDHKVKAGSFILGGKYKQAALYGFNGWVCSSHTNDLEAGTPMRLLKDNAYKGVDVTYYEICSRVQQFLCGVKNLSAENIGTMMTVELRIYDKTETYENSLLVGTYTHRFSAARIGDTYYDSFEAAVAAANANVTSGGVVITLLNDCAVPATYTAGTPLELTRSQVNINLNGYTLTVANAEAFKVSGSDVTVRDEEDNYGGKVACANGNGIYVTGGNFSTLNYITIEGGVCVGGNWGDAWFATCKLTETDANAGAIRTKECGYATVDTGTTVQGALNGTGGTIDVRKGTLNDWMPSVVPSALEFVGGLFSPNPTERLVEPYRATQEGEMWRVAPDSKYVAKIVGQDLSVIGWYDDITNAVNDIINGTVGVIVVLCDPRNLHLPPNCYYKEQNGDQTVIIKYYVGGAEGGTDVSQEAYDSLEQAVDALVSKATSSSGSGGSSSSSVTQTIVYHNYVPGKSPVPDNCKVVKRGNHYELSLKIFYVVEGKQYTTRRAAAEAILNSPNRDTLTIRVINYNIEDADADDSMTKEEFNELFVATDNGDTYTYRKEVYMCTIGTQNYPTFDQAVAAVTNGTHGTGSEIVVNAKFAGCPAPAGWAVRRNGDKFNLVQCVYVCEIDGQKYESAEEAIAALAAGKANGTIVVGQQWQSTLKCPNGWMVKQQGERWVLAMFAANGKDADVNVGEQTSEANNIGQTVRDNYVVAQIARYTKVSGVKLTMTDQTNSQGVVVQSGVRATIEAAKEASNDFVTNFAGATNVHIRVNVVATPCAYTPPTAQGNNGSIKFDVKPQATVTLTENDVVTSTKTVDVTNDMIDTNQLISVSVYTGFEPVQIVHRTDGGKLIKVYERNEIDYDAATGVATVKVCHFSNITATTESHYAAKIGDVYYETLAAAIDAVTSGGTIVILRDNGETISVNKEFAFSMNNDGKFKMTGNVTVTAKDYKFVVGGDGCSYQAKVYVAQVDGGEKYETLAEAVAAIQTTGTITMLLNATISGNAGVTIHAGKTVTLDLNGWTLTGEATAAAASQVILNNGTLTVKNSASGSGKITNKGVGATGWFSDANNSNANNVIKNCGSLTIESGTVKNAFNGANCYAVDNDSTSSNVVFVLRGGTVCANFQSAMRMYCNSATHANAFTMSAGTITAPRVGFKVELAQSYTGSGKAAAVTISGGTVTVTGQDGGAYAWCDSSSVNGIWNSVDYAVTGGAFTGAIQSNGKTRFISGGTYSVEPNADYVADKLVAELNGSVYEIVDKYTIGYELGKDGINNVANPAYYTAKTAGLALSVPSRAGYAFVGWYTDANRSVELENGVIPKDSRSDITLYARWEEGLPVDVEKTGTPQETDTIMLPRSYVIAQTAADTGLTNVTAQTLETADGVAAAQAIVKQPRTTGNKLSLVENYVLGLKPQDETSVPIVVPVQTAVDKVGDTGLTLDVGNILVNKNVDAKVTYVLESSAESSFPAGNTESRTQVDNKLFENIVLPTTGVKYYRIKATVSK